MVRLQLGNMELSLKTRLESQFHYGSITTERIAIVRFHFK